MFNLSNKIYSLDSRNSKLHGITSDEEEQLDQFLEEDEEEKQKEYYQTMFERRLRIIISKELQDPYKELESYLNLFKQTWKVRIKIVDKDFILQLWKFPFHSLNQQCVSMNLQLKGFQTDQQGFEQFCSHFPKFPCLNRLQLRFYNNHIKYLDCLFQSIVFIDEVFLNLKDFRKIKFKESFTEATGGIQRFRIKLRNASFKTDYDQHCLESFLANLCNLTEFKFELKDESQLQLLLFLPRGVDIIVVLPNFEANLKLCDSLISLKRKSNLNITEVETPINMLKLYLSIFGLNVKNPFPQSEDTPFKMNQFSEEDLKLLDEVPELFEIIQQEFYRLDFDLTNVNYKSKRINQELANINPLLKYYYSRILKKQTSIKYQRNLENKMQMIERKIIFPLISRMENIKFTHLSKAHSCLVKKKEYLKINFTYFYCDEIDKRFQEFFQHMIFVKVKVGTESFFSLTEFWQTHYVLMNMIEENNYLLSYDLICPKFTTNGFERDYQILLQNCFEHCEIIKKRCYDKLRFFTFQKYIFDEIPLPQHVFIDLFFY